jgi:hypothetical protein
MNRKTTCALASALSTLVAGCGPNSLICALAPGACPKPPPNQQQGPNVVASPGPPLAPVAPPPMAMDMKHKGQPLHLGETAPHGAETHHP